MMAKAVMRDRAMSSSFCWTSSYGDILPIFPRLEAMMSAGSPKLAVFFPYMSSTIMSMFLRFPEFMAIWNIYLVVFPLIRICRIFMIVFYPIIDPPILFAFLPFSIRYRVVPFLSITISESSGAFWYNFLSRLWNPRCSSVSFSSSEK